MSLPIFLVEDDPVIRDQLVLLTQVSLDARIVGLADSEHEAVLWLHSHTGQWKIAIIDLFLREGTGFGILSNLTGHRRGKVIVLTNSATPDNRHRSMALGADAFFDKSVELDMFLDYCAKPV